MTQSVLLWTLPEASDHALPHIYNEPSPRPHLGAVNVLSFIHFPLHFFVLAIEEVKPGPGTCYAEVLLIELYPQSCPDELMLLQSSTLTT